MAESIGSVSLDLVLDSTKFEASLHNLNKLINSNLTNSFSTLEKNMNNMEKNFNKMVDSTKQLDKSMSQTADKILKVATLYAAMNKEAEQTKRAQINADAKVAQEHEITARKHIDENIKIAKSAVDIMVANQKTAQEQINADANVSQSREKTKQTIINGNVKIAKSFENIVDASQKTAQAKQTTYQTLFNKIAQVTSSNNEYAKSVVENNANVVKSNNDVTISENKVKASMEKTKQTANRVQSNYFNVFSTANYKASQFYKWLVSINNKTKEVGSKKNWNGMLTSLSSITYLSKNAVSAIGNIKDKLLEVADVGAQLVETQNVIDTKLGTAAGDVTAWASSNQTKNMFGMNSLTSSEYAAKFGGIMTTSGFSDEVSGEYAKTLSALVADESSLWNKDYDSTFNAFMSGLFGNTTRAMKNYAVDLSAASLQEYALENGITKTYLAMTQQEKLCLKISKTIQTLRGDAGDFVRTQGTWANQTRMLAENFEQLKMILGQGFIVALTPIIKALNTIMEKMILISFGFKKMMINIFGDDALQSGASQFEDMMGDYEDSAEDASTSIQNSFKDILMPFDDIVKLSKNSGSSSSGVGNGIDQKFLDLLNSGIYDELYSKWENIESDAQVWLDNLYNKTENLRKSLQNLKEQGIANTIKGITDNGKLLISNFVEPFNNFLLSDSNGFTRFVDITNDMLNKVDWETINSHLGDMYSSFEPIAEMAWDGAMDFYEYFLAPLGDWVMNDALVHLADIITDFNRKVDWETLNKNLENFWKALEPKVEAFGNGFLDALGDFSQWCADFINNNCNDALEDVTDFLNNMDDAKAEKLGYGVGQLAIAFLGLRVALKALDPFIKGGASIYKFIEGTKGFSTIAGGTTAAEGASGAAAGAEGASGAGGILGGAGLMETLTGGATFTSGLGAGATLAIGGVSIAVILGGIAMAITALDDLWTKCDWFRTNIENMFGRIGESLGTLKETFSTSAEQIGVAFDPLMEQLQPVFDWFSEKFKDFEVGFGAWFTGLVSVLTNIIVLVINVLSSIITFVVSAITTIVGNILSFGTIVQGILTGDVDMILQGLEGLLNNSISFIKTAIDTIINIILSLVTFVVNVISDIANYLGEGMGDSFLKGWNNMKDTIWNSVGGFAKDIQNWLNSTFGLNLNFADTPTPGTSSSSKSGTNKTNYYAMSSQSVATPKIQGVSNNSTASQSYQQANAARANSNNNQHVLGQANNSSTTTYVANLQLDGKTVATSVNKYNNKNSYR